MSERIDRWREPSFLRGAAVVAVAVLGLIGGVQRARVEARNRAVTLAAEESAVSQMAAASGVTFREALEKLKTEGLGAVVMEEETVGGWLATNRLGFGEGGTIVCWPGAEERIARAIRLRFPASTVKILEPGVLSNPGVPADVLRTLSLGLEAKRAKEVWSSGLTVVWRGASAPMSNDAVRGSIAWARELGAKAFLPLGDRVLGYRDALTETSEALRRAGMAYVSAEFGKIAGDAAMVARVPDLVIRLHTAQTAEIDKMTEREYLDRYARAASERGIRMLLLRPMSDAGSPPLEGFATLTGKVRRALHDEGLSVGVAKPYQNPASPPWLFALTGLATSMLVVVAAHSYGLAGKALGSVAVVLGLIGAACWIPATRPLAAFLAALAAPMLSVRMIELSSARSPWLNYVLACAVSASGGLAVVGLLNGLPYLVRAEQFQGVKAAHALPIAAVGAWFFSRWFDWRSTLRRPVLWLQALTAVAALAALTFMLMRTGNDNPGAVSGIELRLRSLLDQLLLVRPRTKEVFIGHPALFVGLALWVRHRQGSGAPRFAGWVALLLTAGMIGQTSIVNTFCHLHTPFWLGVARVALGALAGGLLGWLVSGLVGPRLDAVLRKESGDG